MSGGLTSSMVGLTLFCVFAETMREVCFKWSATDDGIRAALANPVTWIGIVFWAVEMAAWIVVLEHVPLSVAFPLMALSYVAIVFAGALIFGERINIRHATGVLFVTAGVACVGVTGL